ncbi:MAG: aldo/keto reductase [Nevskiaceae bacterium]|nr:MAG: aldo/keto reductase [Nevskiaceae bacterium]TBR72248.1 MAG: aldo/keto reductase [Nevskiaceae bacterium]
MKYTAFGKTGCECRRLRYGADPGVSKAILDAHADAGGNFIDSTDVYTVGQSEEQPGILLEGQRGDFVLATAGNAPAKGR